jgi:hypothetical protein
MQYDFTQKKCVQQQINSISRSSVVSIEMRIVRVEDLKLESLTTNDELSENEDVKDMKIEITKNILIKSIRIEETKTDNNWIESFRSILKRKIKNESKFATSKTTRFKNWINANKEKTKIFDLFVKKNSLSDEKSIKLTKISLCLEV